MRKRLYAEAIRRWQEFIKQYPKNGKITNAYHHLGVCQIQTQQYTSAATTFRNVLKQFPKSAARDSAQLNLGTALFHHANKTNKPADFQAAAKEFALFTSTYAKSKLAARALYYRAECFCLAGQAQAAIPVYQQILKVHSKSALVPQVKYALAATLQELQQDAGAVATLQEFLKSHKGHPLANDCRLRLGLSLFQLKKFAQAGPIFSQLAGVPKFPYADMARMKFAHTLFETSKYPQAAAQYEMLPKQFPQSQYVGPALLAGGKSRYLAKQLPQALVNFVAIAKQVKLPESAEGAYWQGKTLIDLNRHAEALPVLDKVIAAATKSKHPLMAEMVFARAEALSGIPKQEKVALRAFGDFIKGYAAHALAADAHYRAALSAHNLNEHAAARNYINAFLGNKKWSKHRLASEVVFLAGESYLRGRPQVLQTAETHYRQILRTYGKSRHLADAQLGLGHVLAAQQKHKDVVALLDNLAQKPATGVSKAKQAEAGLLVGRSWLASGQAKQAITALTRAQAATSTWQYADEVLLVLGLAYRDDKNVAQATAQLTTLVGKFPKSVFVGHAYYQLGEFQRLEQKYAPALALYQKGVAAAGPARFAALSQLGMASVYYEQRKHAEAVAACGVILTRFAKTDAPVLATARYLRGMSNQQLGKHKDATTDLQAFLATKPKNEADRLGAQFALARSQIGLKQFAAAATSLQGILKQQPKFERAADVYYELGFVQQALKKPLAAAATFRNLATKFPQHPLAAEAWYRVAGIGESQKKLDDAVTALTAADKAIRPQLTAFKRKPTTPAQQQAMDLGEKIAFQLGFVRYQQQKYDQASAAFSGVLTAFPKGKLKSDALFYRAECDFRTKKFAAALKVYQQVVAGNAKSPHKPAALYRGGLCAIQEKSWKTGEQLFSQLVAAHPKFSQIADARYGLGLSQLNQKKLGDARKSLQSAIAASPNSEVAAKSWFMLGQCSFAEKNYKAAIESFTEVAFGFEHPVWQPLSYFEAGRCYVQLKDYANARKMLTGLIKDFPKHARVKDAQAILANLK